MPTGQAAAVALGVVVVVLGGLYITWRSQQPGRTASILRVLLNVSFISMGLWSGTFLLLMEPHDLIRSGVGILAYTTAVKPAFMGWQHRGPGFSTVKKALLIYSLGNVVAACLLGAGCARYGGSVAVLGAIVAFAWTTLHLWFLKSLFTLDGTGDQTTPI